MSLRVKPLTRDDLRDMVPIQGVGDKKVADITSILDNKLAPTNEIPYTSVLSNEEILEKKFVDRKLFYSKTYINLPISIVNVFTGGTRLASFGKIINSATLKGQEHYYDVVGLNSGTKVLKVEDDGSYTEISLNSVDRKHLTVYYRADKYLLGGDAIKALLEEVDIDDRISTLLSLECRRHFSKKDLSILAPETKGDGCNFCNVTLAANEDEYSNLASNSKYVWLVDKYFVSLGSSACLSSGQDLGTHYNALRAFAPVIREDLLKGPNLKGEEMSTITALLAFRDNKDSIMNQIQDFVVLLPIGYRPAISDINDPLTVMYSNLYFKAWSLENSMMSGYNLVDTVRLAYKEMYEMYYRTSIKKGFYDEENFITLKDRMGGKYGIIRLDVQSAISDYSGRCVITSDYKMSVDTVGIPEDIAFELGKLDAIESLRKQFPKRRVDYISNDDDYELLRTTALELMKDKYIIIGRAPTLYLLGVQAFKIKIVTGASMVLSPATTVAFNADFDGDQMYALYPMNKESREETRKLMANVENPFLPKDGSCHINLRQEMLYGVYIAYNTPENPNSMVRYESEAEFNKCIIDDLVKQDVMIGDKCEVGGKVYGTVGYTCLKLFLGLNNKHNIRLGITPITTDDRIKEKCPNKGFFEALFRNEKLTEGTDRFISMVNRYVLLSFTIANLCAPDMNILAEVSTKDLKEEFEKDIEPYSNLYNEGFGGNEAFSLLYSKRYNQLAKDVTAKVLKDLGDDNGFVQLVKSGARGDKSNLMQLFGMKGTILKNNVESFNFVLKSSLSEGLNDFEHFTTAFGSREGVIDKVIGTFRPGYLSNNIRQTTGDMSIVSDDCGTTDGLHITYDYLKRVCKECGINMSSSIIEFTEVQSMAVRIITGRYILLYKEELDTWVDRGNSSFTEAQAKDLFSTHIASINKADGSISIKPFGVKLRSPMYCKNPCCVHCYGKDLLTNKDAVIGTAVGKISASVVSELITQMIMKTFQLGGVAGQTNLTSSFDVLSDLLRMYSPSKQDSAEDPIVHDFISPVEGQVVLGEVVQGKVLLQVIDNVTGKNKLKKVYMHPGIKVKPYVKVGETVCVDEGILDVNEVLKIRGVDAAQIHILNGTFGIYNRRDNVNFKHFEIIAASMVMMLCMKGNSYFKTGNYYTLKQYHSNDHSNAKLEKMIIGVKDIPTLKANFLEATFWEDLMATVSRNIITSGADELTAPLVRSSLGLSLGMGTDVEGNEYISKRGC